MISKRNLFLVGLLLLLLGFSAFWRFSGASLTGPLKQFILQTAARSVNGSLTVGEVDFSFSGSLLARQVLLTDKEGALIASAETLSVDLNLSDLLGRRIDMERIRKITLDGLVLHLRRNQGARWNTSDIPKHRSEPTAGPVARFLGQVVLRGATVTIDMNGRQYSFKSIGGTLDFARNPDVSLDLESRDGVSRITGKGLWNVDKGGNVDINVTSLDPASFASSIPLKGLVNGAFTVSGTPDRPLAKGGFKIPSGTLGDTSFTEAAGEFSLDGASLVLSNTRLNALGGVVSAAGPLALDTLRFSQTVSGQEIDSSQLSDKDIHGRIQFSADVQGQGTWNGATADGTFRMGAGSISGIAFDALSGNFSKRGEAMRYYNLKVTVAGRVITLGDADSLESLRLAFKSPIIPGVQLPAAPKAPAPPGLPKPPALPRLH